MSEHETNLHGQNLQPTHRGGERVMSDWEQEYEVGRLRGRVRELEAENRKLRDDLCTADYRIRHELEPNIQARHRAYDAWAIDPERG